MRELKTGISGIILLLVIGLGFQGCAFATEQVSLQDKAIGSAFKTLAKGFVVIADINKIKKDNISKINKLKPGKYKRKYAEVYEVIKELPSELKIKYGIIQDMSKEQLIKEIEALDKKKIYKLIEAIPDTFIAKEFNIYLNEKKQGAQKNDLIKEINELWSKMSVKVNPVVLKK